MTSILRYTTGHDGPTVSPTPLTKVRHRRRPFHNTTQYVRPLLTSTGEICRRFDLLPVPPDAASPISRMHSPQSLTHERRQHSDEAHGCRVQLRKMHACMHASHQRLGAAAGFAASIASLLAASCNNSVSTAAGGTCTYRMTLPRMNAVLTESCDGRTGKGESWYAQAAVLQ